MFTTYPQFRFPIQIDKDSTTWRAIEINLRRPFVLATVRAHSDGDEEILLDFIISGDDELLFFSENRPIDAPTKRAPKQGLAVCASGEDRLH
jgi:hypothetical protein